MEPAFHPLTPDQTFRFACHPGVPCFNQCCRNLTQHLTPYDILRLKQHLKRSSAEFLSAHTLESTGPQSGLPIISLKPVGAERLCPFVSDRGCTVYPDRPASCRTYPLARGVGIHTATGERVEQFALIQEPHCQGFAPDQGQSPQKRLPKGQTPSEWVAGQGLEPYNEINDHLLGLIQHKRRRGKAPLNPSQRALFHLALYNLDEFRIRLQEGELAAPGSLTDDAAAALNGDDTHLLGFAIQWAGATLFLDQPNR